MTSTPRADYVPSPLHQGTRSRTGNQVDRQLVHDLLGLLGDCRLLWLPNLTDTTTSVERSRHGTAITWSESLASFDDARARLGSGVSIPFNGTDEEGDVPDAARYSFGDGVADQAFSLVVLASFDTVADRDLLTKYDLTTGNTKREWRFRTGGSGNIVFQLHNESAGANAGRQGAIVPTATWTLSAATYDGSGAVGGIRIFKNGARDDTADNSGGTFTAMEDTGSLVRVAFNQGAAAGANFFDGSMALAAITAKELSVGELWAIKELVNGYFGLSL